MENKKVFLIIFVLVLIGVGFFAYIFNFNSQYIPEQGAQINSPVWKTYKPDNANFELQYPEELNTKYASFNLIEGVYPFVMVTPKNKDSNSNYHDGCFASAMDSGKVVEPDIVINNMHFCLTAFSDPGAGQLYTTYFYTTLRNGTYYTLNYAIHTLNGCGPYMDTPDYQPCMDFFKNYENIVMKPIQDSVATLKFTK